MRLAETIQELSSAENADGRALDEPIFQAGQPPTPNPQRVAELRRQQEQHMTNARNHRQQLIRTFEVLVTDHPTYNRMDAVLFYLAFAYSDMRDQTNARRVYLTLIQRFPQSPFVPNAYLSFAEFFFEQGAMDEARQFYERVTAINTPENTVYGYALYKLAWVHFNLQDFMASLNTFYQVIDYARAHPDMPSVAPLIRSARQELVSAYGQTYGTVARPLRTQEALRSFRQYGADEEGAFTMLESLGGLYQDNGQWANSISVFRELISQRSTSDKVCAWQAQIAKAFIAQGQRDAQMRELTRLLDLWDTYRAPTSGRSQDARNSCRDATARLVFDVASHWHLEAIGRSVEGATQTRGTRDNATMGRAAQLYDLLVERFPDLDDVTFPDYDRRDWPTRYRIAYYRADILRDQGNFEACGAAYDRVVEMNPGGEFTEDSAYKAVLCYNDQFTARLQQASRQRPSRVTQAQQQQPATGARRNQPDPNEAARFQQRDFNDQERAMERAFGRYICFGGGAIAAQ